jgi:hypothetical protein
MNKPWTGPRDEEMTEGGTMLRHIVPPERWPYGPPGEHEDCCMLHLGGLYCDCLASDGGTE